MIRTILAVCMLLLVAAGQPAVAQDTRDFRIRFPSGQTGVTVNDRVNGYETVVYRLAAKRGQVMALSLSSPSGSVYFNVYSPGRGPGDTAMARSDVQGPKVPAINRFQGPLPADGEYRIAVYQARPAARRGERPAFRLVVNINAGAVQLPGGGVVPEGQGDAAFLRVTGVGSGDSLNVRGGPSTGNPVIFTLRNGDVVRNLGCRTSGETRWCQVHRPGQVNPSGWASARFLVAARDPGNATQLPEAPQTGTQLPGTGRPPGASQLPDDALVPGTNYNATGTLDCVIGNRPQTCPFGVIRRGRGNATLFVASLSGDVRRIEFEGGRPTTSNAPGDVYGEFMGNGSVLVYLGSRERYSVPDAVLFGG